MTTEVTQTQQRAVVKWKGESITITFADVKTLICPLATPQEVGIFLKTCQSLQLNPFAAECYLIKYSLADKAAFVIDIDSYLKAAETNKQYDGCEAGIILSNLQGYECREGAFLLDGERSRLAGGWAKVYRKDRSRPTYVAVNKLECVKLNREGKPTEFWTEAKQPWMVRKVALKRALVEAFPSLFAGTLASAEVGGDMDAEYREIPEGTLPPALEKKGKPNWQKFWTRVKSELGLTQVQARELLHVKSIRKDVIDQGWTMERMWNALVEEVQAAHGVLVDKETGEVITPERVILDTEKSSAELEEELFGDGEEQASPQEPELKRDPESIKTIAELCRACYEDFKIQPGDVCKELGYTSAAAITETPADCYRKIAAMRR